ncbi:MAG TPA: hypothetical protein VI997_09765 [Candidatus Thermoplasmatota archaeon]|nr:hypothetical protein [Candidatus Thermoplasmatota archaeon]
MTWRTSLVTLACLALASLAGCFGGPDLPTSLVVPPPRIGDVVEYEVTGEYAELVRWEPELPIPIARVRVSVGADGERIDAGLRRDATYAVRTEADGGAGWQLLDTRFVATGSHTVVQMLVPFNETERVVSWEEHGAPWLFGASALFGRTVDGALDAPVPAVAGQDAPLPLPFRVVMEDDGPFRVTAEGPVSLEYAWRPGETYPESFRVVVHEDAGGFVAAGFPRDADFEGRKVSESRGVDVLPQHGVEPEVPPAVAALARFDGRKPPEAGDALVFPLKDAMRAAETQDLGLRAFLDAAPESVLYRATYYLAAPAAAGAPREPTWNLAYVSPEEAYYEAKVGRIAGLAIHRTYESGPVEPPRGEHGWIDPATLPGQMLPLDAAVARFTETFAAASYEIFVRSFAGDARTPAGYYYLIDGGFEEPGGRYTTTWNAQTGRLESAVGPVGPK